MKKQLVLCQLAIAAFMCLTITEANDKRFKVLVAVHCQNKELEGFMENYIKRELIALGDVEISKPHEADYFIDIVAIEQLSKTTQEKTGSVSLAHCWYHRETIPVSMIDKGALKAWKVMSRLIYSPPRIGCMISNVEEIAKTCHLITVLFRRTYLK